MSSFFQTTPARREYTRWVANETMEDFALRFTARRARKWSHFRVANTALGSISFLALEAIGAAITLTHGFDTAVIAIMLVGAILFLTGLPISYYAARYGVDIDLLTRGAGFGYIGSTITSLIYASFTFIFFALEASILALALEFCFGIPLAIGYILSALVVIPLVVHGFTKISAFQMWTQPFWIFLHLLPFVLLGYIGYDIEGWVTYPGITEAGVDGTDLLMLGAASGVILSLIAQIGEQVDFLRFLPEPETKADRRRWWAALLAAGPGWAVLGVIKMLAGSYLVTLALSAGVPAVEATDPTQLYYTAFDVVLASPGLVLILTGAFVILSQLKINVTNAYAGSIAWSNFFSRLTHSHPGRVVWLVFNVSIALVLMEFGVFRALETTLALYSHVALAWVGSVVADLVINKPLRLSPQGIEFRRAYLYDINPVGLGSMGIACVISLFAYTGFLGALPEALSSFIALFTAIALAPLIAWGTKGRYYVARQPAEAGACSSDCVVCGYTFDAEDSADCPFYGGKICSLCCTLDSNCRDSCKPEARAADTILGLIRGTLGAGVATAVSSRLGIFFSLTGVLTLILAGVLGLFLQVQGTPDFGPAVGVVFCVAVLVIGISVWMFILVRESHVSAVEQADLQTQRLLREVRAHERTDRQLQQAKERAEAANLAKTRYLTGLSHELRTPLNSIFGFAQILEADPEIPERRRDAVLTIRRASEHLAGLIEGLLDISKIEAGRLDIHRNRINLPAFLDQIASIFEEQARQKGLRFNMVREGMIPTWIMFDEKRLRQIIINLLSNAIRYTDSGEVHLRVAYRNEIATIEAVDTGRGIKPDDLEKIWKPFERGGVEDINGTGLGLTITKLLVEILGGDIEVETCVGEGSRFRVRLMLPSVPETAMMEEPSQAKTARGAVAGYAGRRRKILVVDDDLNHLSLVEGYFAPLGFQVLLARSCGAAELILRDATPDIFILDIDLPSSSGWELATSLRRNGHRATPIIMISGHALEARTRGPEDVLHDAFVAKPYNLADLLQRIATLLQLQLEYSTDEEAQGSSAAAVLSKKDLERILVSARIGHASGLSDVLADVKARPGAAPAELAEIERMLCTYDLRGIEERVVRWLAT